MILTITAWRGTLLWEAMIPLQPPLARKYLNSNANFLIG
jgi:hypothetical protein